jgi:hypothetical protein
MPATSHLALFDGILMMMMAPTVNLSGLWLLWTAGRTESLQCSSSLCNSEACQSFSLDDVLPISPAGWHLRCK